MLSRYKIASAPVLRLVLASALFTGCVHRAQVMSRDAAGTYVLMSAPNRIDRALEELATTAREICGEHNYQMSDPVPHDEYVGTAGGEVSVQTRRVSVRAGNRRSVSWGRRAYRAEVRCLQTPPSQAAM